VLSGAAAGFGALLCASVASGAVYTAHVTAKLSTSKKERAPFALWVIAVLLYCLSLRLLFLAF
jgi:hypothetical protein